MPGFSNLYEKESLIVGFTPALKRGILATK